MRAEEKIISKFLRDHIAESLQIIEDYEPDQIALLLESLPFGESAMILSKLNPYLASKACRSMKLEYVVSALQLMPLQAAEHLLRQIEVTVREHIISGLPANLADHYKRVLEYSSDAVGAALNPFYLTLTPERTVQDALKLIKMGSSDIGSCLYVLDDERQLLGYIDLKDLITRQAEELLRNFMKPVGQQAKVDMNLKELVESWDSPHDQLPVVDSKGFFLGVVEKASLSSVYSTRKTVDSSMIKAGNALGDVYLIGLTGLFGSTNPTDIK